MLNPGLTPSTTLRDTFNDRNSPIRSRVVLPVDLCPSAQIMSSTVEVNNRATDDSSRKRATGHGNVDKDSGIGWNLLESLALGPVLSTTTCIQRSVRFEVNTILVNHEPA